MSRPFRPDNWSSECHLPSNHPFFIRPTNRSNPIQHKIISWNDIEKKIREENLPPNQEWNMLVPSVLCPTPPLSRIEHFEWCIQQQKKGNKKKKHEEHNHSGQQLCSIENNADKSNIFAIKTSFSAIRIVRILVVLCYYSMRRRLRPNALTSTTLAGAENVNKINIRNTRNLWQGRHTPTSDRHSKNYWEGAHTVGGHLYIFSLFCCQPAHTTPNIDQQNWTAVWIYTVWIVFGNCHNPSIEVYIFAWLIFHIVIVGGYIFSYSIFGDAMIEYFPCLYYAASSTTIMLKRNFDKFFYHQKKKEKIGIKSLSVFRIILRLISYACGKMDYNPGTGRVHVGCPLGFRSYAAHTNTPTWIECNRCVAAATAKSTTNTYFIQHNITMCSMLIITSNIILITIPVYTGLMFAWIVCPTLHMSASAILPPFFLPALLCDKMILCCLRCTPELCVFTAKQAGKIQQTHGGASTPNVVQTSTPPPPPPPTSPPPA